MQIRLDRTELEEAITKHVFTLLVEHRLLIDEEGVFQPTVDKVTIHDGGTGATAEISWWPSHEEEAADAAE